MLFKSSICISGIKVRTLKIAQLFFIILICNVLLTSCFTIKYSTTGASISPDVKTASVVYFTSRATLAPATISQQFTEKFREKVRSNTTLNLLNEGGDVNFEGEITGFSVAPVAIQSNDKAAKNRLTITIHVKYNNSIDPKFNFDENFSRYKDYESSKDLEQVSASLIPDILDLISEDVFNKAFVNW